MALSVPKEESDSPGSTSGSDALARARQAKRTRLSLPKKLGRNSSAPSSAPSGPDEPPTSAPSSISGCKEEAVAASGKAPPEEAKAEVGGAATAARSEGSAADVIASRASSDCNSQPVGAGSSQAEGSSESF